MTNDNENAELSQEEISSVTHRQTGEVDDIIQELIDKFGNILPDATETDIQNILALDSKYEYGQVLTAKEIVVNNIARALERGK